MKVTVEAKTKARQERVEELDKNVLRVWVRELPEKGAANAAVERALARFYRVSPSRVRVISGQRSRKKIVEILL